APLGGRQVLRVSLKHTALGHDHFGVSSGEGSQRAMTSSVRTEGLVRRMVMKRIVLLSVWSLLLLWGGGGGCGGGGGEEVSIKISPTTVSLGIGRTQTFTVTILGSTNTTVEWQVQEGMEGGIITSDGVYTAPNKPGIYHVVATSQEDPTKRATATITVLLALAPVLSEEADEVHKIKLRVLPSIAEPGARIRLTVDGYSRIGNEVSIRNEPKLWTASGDLHLLRSETPEGQQLLSGPLHTASNDVELQVKEREAIDRSGTVTFGVQVAGRSATASLQVMLSASGLLSLYVQPPTIGLAPGTKQQFKVVARDAQGVAVPAASVIWEATDPLDVNAQGVVTVPLTVVPGVAKVTAKVADGEGNKSRDTAEVVISANAPENRVFEVLVYPRSVRLYTGSSLNFLAVAIDRTGVVIPGAEWRWGVDGGAASIHSLVGLLTAGTTEGEVHVTATLTNAEEVLSGGARATVEVRP
ncbi:MAG: hypothetical protein QXQ53_09270, partial [Candidatus Methanosuratincola sp.]